MVERFGIQDHDQQVGSTRLQNPTNPGSFQNLGGGDSGGNGFYMPQIDYNNPHPDLMDKIRNWPKSMIAAVLLAGTIGPWGVLYTSWRTALAMMTLVLLAGYLRAGGSIEGIGSETTMTPIWNVARVVAVGFNIWWMLRYKRNRKEKAEQEKLGQTPPAA